MESIIGKKIRLDRYTCPMMCEPDPEHTRLFLKSVEHYINDFLHEAGYISWEKIVTSLCMMPDPDDIESTSVYRDDKKVRKWLRFDTEYHNDTKRSDGSEAFTCDKYWIITINEVEGDI